MRDTELRAAAVPVANDLADLLPRVRAVCMEAHVRAPSRSQDIPHSTDGYLSDVHRQLSRAGNSMAQTAEALTMAYHRQQGVDTAIMRIFNTYGPRMRPNDGRAIPNFITQALAGEPITAAITEAPAGGAIGGLRVSTESAWFAARPSGTEDVYKIYAESFKGEDHVKQVQKEAKALVADVLGQ